MKRFTWVKLIKGIVCAVAIVAVIGTVTKYLWNWLMPELFNLPVITFWQALGLFLLSKLLLSGFHKGGGGHRKHWRDKMAEKMKHMSPEEREKMREKFQKCWSKAKYEDFFNETAHETTPPVENKDATNKDPEPPLT